MVDRLRETRRSIPLQSRDENTWKQRYQQALTTIYAMRGKGGPGPSKLPRDGMLAELNCGNPIPHERVLHALHLLCDKIMPHCR